MTHSTTHTRTTHTNTRAARRITSYNGHSPDRLPRAATLGLIDEVVTLLAAGVPVDTRGSKGATPLIAACNECHLEVAKTLAVAGADVNAVDDDGYTPLATVVRGLYSTNSYGNYYLSKYWDIFQYIVLELAVVLTISQPCRDFLLGCCITIARRRDDAAIIRKFFMDDDANRVSVICGDVKRRVFRYLKCCISRELVLAGCPLPEVISQMTPPPTVEDMVVSRGNMSLLHLCVMYVQRRMHLLPSARKDQKKILPQELLRMLARPAYPCVALTWSTRVYEHFNALGS